MAEPRKSRRERKATLRVAAFGGFDVTVGDLPVEIRSKKAQALLVYLLLNPMPVESRERLCGLLWSESPENKARASLRQVLHGLHKALVEQGFEGLVLERESVRLDRDGVQFDLATMQAALERGETPVSLSNTERPAEALLAGFDGLDPGFDVWLAIQRRMIAQNIERKLTTCLAAAVTSTAKVAAAAALMNLDPTNEHACREMMLAYTEHGETAAALKVYKQLWDHLDADFETEPAPETQAIAVRLKSEPHSPVRTHVLIAPRPLGLVDTNANRLFIAPPQRAVVVAPFDSRGVGGEFTYLINGLRQDLIAKLVRFREWAIIDGQHIGETNRDAFEARWPHQIWIDALLVQAGSQLKAIVAVREQPEATLIWSDAYRFDLDNWFDLEREVLARIAATMNLHVSAARLAASSGAPDVSLEIYDRWLRGQSIIMNWRPERHRAREIYRAILYEAPNFSPAYSSLAQLDSGEHLAFPGVFRTREREQAGLDHATLAVRSDPFDSRAHLALGWASAMNGLFDQSYAAFQTALELNENDMWTINSAALGTAYCGDAGHSVTLVKKALSLGLQPTGLQWAFQGVVHFLAGDYAATIGAHERSGDVLTDIPAWQAAAYALTGKKQKAAEAARRFVERSRSRWAGEEPASDELVMKWVLHCFPIRDRASWECLRDGLSRAGLPIPRERAIPRHP